MACVQHAERGLQVSLCDPSGLWHRSDRVVKFCSRIPDGVPDPVRERADVRAPRVQQDDVQVAARGELAAAVTTHGDERHRWLRAEQAREPPVGFRRPLGALGGERHPGDAPDCHICSPHLPVRYLAALPTAHSDGQLWGGDRTRAVGPRSRPGRVLRS